jgi:hypothetical protein
MGRIRPPGKARGSARLAEWAAVTHQSGSYYFEAALGFEKVGVKGY